MAPFHGHIDSTATLARIRVTLAHLEAGGTLYPQFVIGLLHEAADTINPDRERDLVEANNRMLAELRDARAALAAVHRAIARIFRGESFDLAAHLTRQRLFSEKTFGPGARTQGIVDHIRKELAEIEADPDDIAEWIDVIILAFDGAWRAGYDPYEIIASLIAKQTRNEARTWPDWRTADPDKAIEHIRE